MTDKALTTDANWTNVTTVTGGMIFPITDSGELKDVTAAVVKGYVVQPIQGGLINGYISRTVASNNLTVAVKTLAGADPSAGDPVYVRIGNTVRVISAALSVTKNAGTNWCNSGGSELATKEIDYFVYMGYNATDGTVIGFSRIPTGRVYGDFSTTSTNEKYAAISTITTAAATDEYEVVGRFNATLSAGAGYTWSVPATSIVISRPIFETRWLSWVPTVSCSGSLTYGTVSYEVVQYMIDKGFVKYTLTANGTLGGSASNIVYFTAPFDCPRSADTNTPLIGWTFVGDGSTTTTGLTTITAGTPDKLTVYKYNLANYATSGTGNIRSNGEYEI